MNLNIIKKIIIYFSRLKSETYSLDVELNISSTYFCLF